MTVMKKLILFCLGISFFACNKQDTIPLLNAELAAITFNEYNPCLESFEVDPLLVPNAIQEMINSQYPSAKILVVKGQNDNGTLFYGVQLDNEKELLFSTDATVLVENTTKADEVIAIQDLSTTLRTFVAANFSGSSIESATKMDEFGNQYLKISLGQNNQLIFDTSENFICASGNFNNDDDDDEGGYGEEGDDDDG